MIRTVTPNDVTALSRLLVELDFRRLRGWHDDRLREFVGQLLVADSQRSCYVASSEDDLAVIGFAQVHWLDYLILGGQEGYISELFVAESQRGRGLGSLLLEAIEAEAANRGVVRLSLLQNKEREAHRRDFYGKRGWQMRGDFMNYVKSEL